MNETKIIIWNEELSVGVKELDEQHKELILVVNELYEAVEQENVNFQVIGDILKKVSTFADFHFATEEKYFDEFDYENAEEHKEFHRKLKSDISKMIDKQALNDISVFIQLVAFLNGWIEDHLSRDDKKYTKCFNEHGLY